MALRLPHLFSLILWLSLFLLLFHGWFSFTTTNRSAHNSHISLSHRTLISNRKVLAGKIDFTVFLRHRHQLHHSHSNVPVQPGSAGTEIDPRYGMEKRLVPTGPNPLHH
ncbi:CLAVATA3/ESR (CLE)-related protein 13 [Morella rubra]|uniref:CLAVATA3/ESR (CLE)-related protein 13 n=1 Tax=Morella rubra TaxID=262757 RepID=A0A6A1VJ94_9ROSI|nr:CLAVATA3/ESR (CLE)-related protein 13 [Morella rubra]